MNLTWWSEHTTELPLLLLTAAVTHLLISFSQTVMHYDSVIGGWAGYSSEITSIITMSIIRKITWYLWYISKMMATTHRSF